MEEDKIATMDIPSYHWPTKEEGKAQYPQFAKVFQGTLKGLRIDRYLGSPPGRRPSNADERAKWLAKTNNYQNKLVLLYCTRSFREVVSLRKSRGFDNFQSESHRLHAEILATGVDDAVTERELNDIVRDGIKNQFVLVNVCYNLYRDNTNAP